LHYIPTLVLFIIILFPIYFFVTWKFLWPYLPYINKYIPATAAYYLPLIIISIPIVLFLIILLFTFINRMSHTFIVTSSGVKHKKGIYLISHEKSSPMIPFSKLQWIKPEQNRMEQILGIGRILFETASDNPGPDMMFFGIEDIYYLAEKIQEMMQGTTQTKTGEEKK